MANASKAIFDKPSSETVRYAPPSSRVGPLTGCRLTQVDDHRAENTELEHGVILAGIGNFWHDKEYSLAGRHLLFPDHLSVRQIVLAAGDLVSQTGRTAQKAFDHTHGRPGAMINAGCVCVLVTVKLGALAIARIEEVIYYFAASLFLAMAVSTMPGYLV